MLSTIDSVARRRLIRKQIISRTALVSFILLAPFILILLFYQPILYVPLPKLGRNPVAAIVEMNIRLYSIVK
jgi:hypothetical protein